MVVEDSNDNTRRCAAALWHAMPCAISSCRLINSSDIYFVNRHDDRTGYLNYAVGGDFQVHRLGEIRRGRLSITSRSISPNRCSGGVWDEHFTQFRNINALQGCIPFAIFTKFSCSVNYWNLGIRSRDFGIMGFTLEWIWEFYLGYISLKFSAPHSAIIQMPTCFGDAPPG